MSGVRPLTVALVLIAGCDRDATTTPSELRVSPLTVLAGSVRGSAGDGLGATIARAGDLDGDGFEDVALGLPERGAGKGRVLIVHGGAAGLDARTSTIDLADVGGRFGAALAFVGDVDGDGLGDLAVGAPRVSAPEVDEGAALVFRGGAAGLAAGPLWRMELNVAGLGFGARVAAAGDVTGDGRADVIIVAVDAAGRGTIYLYTSERGTLGSTPAWSTSGTSAAGAGDVDGDGVPDLVVGDAGAGAGGVCRVLRGRGRADAPIDDDAWAEHAGGDGERLGAAVAMLGDVDGDGRADVGCGAPDADGGAGRVLVVRGGEARAPIDLRGQALGVSALGGALAPAGDVNGDGLADVLLGARGRALVLAGAFDDPLAHEAWRARCEGCADDGGFGEVVAPVGDVDGDGLADVAVGAPRLGSPDAPGAGAIDVRLGAAGPPRREPFDTRALPRYEEPRNQRMAVAIQGDAGGSDGADGRDDLFTGRASEPTTTGEALGGIGEVWGFPYGPGDPVGIHGARATAAGRRLGAAVALVDWDNSGVATPVYGSSGAVGLVPDAGRVQIYGQVLSRSGTTEGERLGAALAAIGDVNGDGFGDFVVGAPGARRALAEPRVGGVYVYRGGVIERAGPDTNDIQVLWSALGDIADGELGAAVAGVGDIDGDALADVVVGAPGADRIWLVRGSRSALAVEPIVAPASHTAGGRFGAAVAAAGDVDGDGLGDWLVGAPEADASRGRVYLYRGSRGVLGAPQEIPGAAPGDRLGASVASAGDLDLDGHADVILGAPGVDVGAAIDAGRALVLRGSEAGLALEPWWVVDGDRAGAGLGDVVAGGGDLDGDRVGDLVVGARDHAADHAVGGDDAQRWFVFRGNGPAPRAREPRPTARRVAAPEAISPGGRSNRPDAFLIELHAASPFGPERVALEVVATPVASTAASVTRRSGWLPYLGDPIAIRQLVDGLVGDTAYAWRARVLYDPAGAAPQAASRWFHGGHPGQPTRAHLRTRDNAAPVAGDDAYRCASDVGLDVTAPGLLDDDHDPDGDALVATLTDGSATGASAERGAISVRPDGGFSYRPEPGFMGRDRFTYRVSDGAGGDALAEVTIVVVPAGCDPDVALACASGLVRGALSHGDGARGFRCRVSGEGDTRALVCDTDARGDLRLFPEDACAP
ncbi:MAG: FG-GAP repeat protein [Deltaproteobacteria bacterium]|nr:FG-GAP repeat protein [Deltaproteobacteria bacterium]